jgi:hypothetical protein
MKLFRSDYHLLDPEIIQADDQSLYIICMLVRDPSSSDESHGVCRLSNRPATKRLFIGAIRAIGRRSPEPYSGAGMR